MTKPTNARTWVKAGLLLPLLVLTKPQPSFAGGTITNCVDPTPPVTDDESGGGTTTEGHIGDLSMSDWLRIDWGSLHRTPFNDDLWTWLFGDEPPPDDGGNDEPPGGSGGSSNEPPADPGYVGASYEGWSTAGPGCGQVGYVLMAYPANLAVLEGDHFTITARPNPFLTVTLIRFLKPRPVPWWIKARYGLQGNWAIGIGVHRLFGGKLRLPLVRLP